jgi:hypothetical protein
MELDDSRSQAIALKEKGNDAFKAHDYPASVKFYSQAIDRYDKEPSFYTNRAQVRIIARSRARLPFIGTHQARSVRLRHCRRD